MRIAALLMSFAMSFSMLSESTVAYREIPRDSGEYISAVSIVSQGDTIRVSNSALAEEAAIKRVQANVAAVGQTVEQKTRQYGEYFSYLRSESSLNAKIAYPITGISKLDEQIAAWADQTFEAYVDHVGLLKSTSPDAVGDLVIDYASYNYENKVVSVELTGTYTYTGADKPVLTFKVITFDLEYMADLQISECFSEEGRAEVLELIKQSIADANPEVQAYIQLANQTWLDTALIKSDGMEFIVAAGETIPYYLGDQRAFITFNKLSGIFLMPKINSEYFLVRKNLDTDKPMVALTFDDGPCVTTQKILDLLDEFGGKATFCMVGNRVSTYPEIVNNVVSQGSEIVGHSWAHSDLTTLSEEGVINDIQATENAIFDVAGVRPLMVRAPYGSFNGTVKAAAYKANKPLLQWSIDSLDWKTQNAQSTHSNILSAVKDGSVILCHDLWTATGAAMETVIPELISNGYQLVTISELMYYKGVEMQPGLVYYSGS